MMKKLLLAFLVVLAILAVPTMAVNVTGTSSNYAIEELSVNGIDLDQSTSIIYVERGELLPITAILSGADNIGDVSTTATDVNMKAWLGGYEYDDVQVTSEMFEIEEGVTYRKVLSLAMPTDLEANQEYSLYVEIYDDSEYVKYTATIMVEKTRHLLSVQDILVEDAEAGDYVTATVRLENMGDKKEEDIKVTVSSEELGISKSTYLDELTNEELDNEDEETSGDVTLTFQIPADAETGDYTLSVLVTYDRGYETLEDSAYFHVTALEVEDTEVIEDSTVTVVISADDVVIDSNDEVEENDFSTALRLGFGILAVLIVILALILIVRR